MSRPRTRLIAHAGIGAAVAAVCLWSLAGWLVLRLDRRVDTLDARIDGVWTEVAALERRAARSDTRLSWVGRKLQAVGHPLRPALSWPVPGPLLSGFGQRASGWHAGIDLDGPAGSTVRPATLGIVIDTGWDDGYGNRVVIAHGRGLETLYAHLELIAVDVGELVTEATPLGTIGCTGSCSDAHLHFEIRLNGVPGDPLMWLPARRPTHSTELPWAG